MKSTKSGQSNWIEQPPHWRICTSWIVPLLLLWVLPAGLGLMLAGRATAQTFTTMHSFDLSSSESTPQTRSLASHRGQNPSLNLRFSEGSEQLTADWL